MQVADFMINHDCIMCGSFNSVKTERFGLHKEAREHDEQPSDGGRKLPVKHLLRPRGKK